MDKEEEGEGAVGGDILSWLTEAQEKKREGEKEVQWSNDKRRDRAPLLPRVLCIHHMVSAHNKPNVNVLHRKWGSGHGVREQSDLLKEMHPCKDLNETYALYEQ